jgi:hypothetical protein
VNWTKRTQFTGSWISISLSSTGQYQSAVIYSGGSGQFIYTSSDYGVNWTKRTQFTGYWHSISLSSTGQYQSAVINQPGGDGQFIYTSSDYGVNWTKRTQFTGYWYSISLSSTGQYQSAVISQYVVGFAENYIYISSNFGETWSSAATDSRSLGIAYGKDASGVGMWVATAGRRDRNVAANLANTMAYSYDGKLWRGIRASAGLSEQAWSVAYGKDGFGVGMWVAAGYDTTCGLKWSYDGVTWNATMGASGAAVWAGAAAGRRALSVYWTGSMWLASTSDTRNGEPRGVGIAANNASSVPGYLLYSYNGKNWLPVLAPNTYDATISSTAQASVYSVLPNPAILDFGSFYDDQSQRGVTIANTTARTVGAVMSGGVPIENVNTIVPYGRGSLTTGQVPFLLGGDSGLVETGAGVVGVAGAGAPPVTSDLAATTSSLSTSTDGGITWRAVPNSTKVMTKVNKILCDETTQQIVAVGTGNYSVATSTPAKAADADGWTGVFGSRMTDTRAGLFEKYGTGASWFGGAKMWIASGRAQSRRGSSLAVSVNGTVWQDAKIVSQVAAGSAGAARGGGLVSRTTTSLATQVFGLNNQDVTASTGAASVTDVLYAFSTFTFTNASATGRLGPTLSAVRSAYSSATWAQDTVNKYLDMTSDNGIQLWTVPATGSYTIRAVGAGVPYDASYSTNGMNQFQKGMDATITTNLIKGEVIRILVGQIPIKSSTSQQGGAGGTFVVRGTQTPIIVAGGGGGRGGEAAETLSNATTSNSGQNPTGGGLGGTNGNGGSIGGNAFSGGGGGLLGNGANSAVYDFNTYPTYSAQGGQSFVSGGLGGISNYSLGGFGGGGAGSGVGGGGGGGGYSGGGAGAFNGTNYTSGGGGGSYSITGSFTSATANNTGNGSVVITANFQTVTYLTMTNTVIIPYTAPATPLLTYTDSAAAFSTQVSSVAVNSQYNRAVVGGSGVQFVAGGRGGTGLVVSNDGQNWTAAATVFQTPTNTTTRTGNGGFDASFGTVALTQRLTTPATYQSGDFRGISVSKTGQYQTAVVQTVGNIWTSSDYGITWTERTTGATRDWKNVSISSTGQYQTAVVSLGNIWTSSDYGVTWTSRATSLDWRSVSLSSTGQYQISAVWGSSNIHTSSNYGVDWTPRPITSGSWSSFSISSSGQYQSAVAYSGDIWISSDFGVSWSLWSLRVTGVTRPWNSISISSTGQYQTAVVAYGNIWISSNYGVNWATHPIVLNWTSVSLSSTGQYQTAVVSSGQIYTSSDYGNSWTPRDSSRVWISVSISSTGQYQSAVVSSGNIFTSSDFGVTWVQRSTSTRTNAFTRVRSSASGQYQLATSGPVGNTNGQLYVSSDYGRTWMPRRGLATWLGGAVSATGGIMTAFLTPTAATAAILRSTDYGATFTDISGTALTSPAYWRAIAATNSAAVQTAVAYGGAIYRSSDYGSSWSNAGITIDGNATTNTVTPRNWQDVAVSAETGAVQVTCVSGGYLYVSNNTGANWVSTTINIDGVATQTTNRVWQAVAVSADGQYGLACVNSTTAQGFLYRSTNAGSTWVSSSIVIDGAGTQTTNRPWQDVAMTANGKYQAACLNTNTQTSSSSNLQNAVSVMVPPPGAVEPTYGANWGQLGSDILGTQAGETSGTSVSLSADGTVIAVGSNGYDITGTNEGRVRIYKYNGTSWGQLGSDIVGTQPGENTGISVSLSADGTTVAIGSYAYDVTGTNNEGRVRIYKYNGTSWGQLGSSDIVGTQTSEYSGESISLSSDGTTVAIGSYAYTATTTSAGRTRIYKYNGTSWGQLGLDILGTQAYEYSGISVSLSADGTVIAIGSYAYTATTTSEGRTRIYKYNGTSWGQLGSDIVGTQVGETSGISVSLSADGTVIAIGSYAYDVTGTNEGRVRIYKYNGTSWGQLGSDILGTQASEQSGISVSLSADGTVIAIGSNAYDVTGANNEGRTRIYKYNGTSWGQLGLDILGTQAGERSGNRLSLSADGTTVAIGSNNYDVTGANNEGRTRIYRIPVTNAITYTSSSSSIADICGNLILIKGANGTSNITATQGATTTNGTLNVSGTTYTLTYTITTASSISFIYYSKNYGASWTSLTAAGSRSWSSIALSENGSTISATTNDSTGGVWVYSMPDDQFYQPSTLINTGATTPATVRAIAYGNSGTGAAVDGYWVAGADASANTLAYSSNGIEWTAVAGSKTTLFNAVNGVAYGADAQGTPMWVAVGQPFVGSVPGTTAYSIAYSYNMTTWTGVRNAANFTGQGNHVAYGQDEFGAGMWVAVGQADGVLAANLGDSSFYNSNGATGTTVFYSYDGANWAAGTGAGIFAVSGTDVTWGVDASGVGMWVATGIGLTDPTTGAVITGGQVAHSTNGRVWTPVRTSAPITPAIFTPFPGAVAGDSPCVAYGRAGSQGTGAPLWIVANGGGGTNVFAMSSAPTTLGAWSVVASNAPSANAPFPVCNSLAYSNGVWVAGNNTSATNIIARSTDGGVTWTPVTASSISGILTGSAAIGANAFCNYSLAYADYSNDTNLRSWVAIQGTKNFMFDAGVSAVATPTPNITASAYNGTGRAWWTAGGRNQSVASIAYTTDPSGATGWTLGTSNVANGGNGIADLQQINAIAFSPHTQNWLAAGVGSSATPTRTALYSANGISWTSTVVSASDASLNLNTCVWNQLDASASSAGRWLAGGTRSGVDASAVSLYISADVSGHTWSPIVGTGAILSQVYSLAFNGSVWIAAGTPAISNGSTSTLMRTTDPIGATGWQGIAATNVSTSGFDTAARSITWNAEQQMWVATGENTGTAADASFSSIIYSRDATGAAGTWRSVRESNSFCFSGEGMSVVFKGDRWFAAGQGTNQIVATTGTNAANAATATWTPITHGTALTSISDIAYTGRRLVATGSSTSGASNGVIYSTDNSGSVWTAAPATPGPGFTDALGGGTSITFEPTIEGGAGHVVATGRSASNTISISTDGGVSWNVSAAPSVQFSTLDASFAATTQPLFTTGGNSVAYVGNDTLFTGGANDVQWTGKRWVATGRNTVGTTATTTATASTSAPLPDVINNNTSAVATSDDGMTWQCVSASQASPNFTEGTVIASNPRIGPTPLINSQIVVSDGGDTEPNTDYGGMTCGMGGSGTGVAQIDIIAELPPVSNAASSGAVNILGAAVNAPTASFDNASFAITTRPI